MDIKAQAELRRKKILANAEARLKKITGKPIENIKVTDGTENPQPVNGVLHDCPEPARTTSSDETESSFTPPNDSFSGLEDDIFSRTHGSGSQRNKSESLPDTSDVFGKIDSQNIRLQYYLFLILGFTVRLVLYLGFSEILFRNALGPFLVVCIPLLPRIYSSAANTPGLISLTSLAGSHHYKLQIFIKIISTIRATSQFFALYFFSFVLTHSILGQKLSR